jgi:hypothetical protein
MIWAAIGQSEPASIAHLVFGLVKESAISCEFTGRLMATNRFVDLLSQAAMAQQGPPEALFVLLVRHSLQRRAKGEGKGEGSSYRRSMCRAVAEVGPLRIPR